MKIIIACDSFKGSLPAVQVCESIERGVKKAGPDIHTVNMPVSDGGEGLVEVIAAAAGGFLVKERVNDPIGREIEAEYALINNETAAVIEMAAASGLPLLTADERDPCTTSTFGTGQLIQSALDRGVDSIIVGIGGSATVDGGTGMAAALGAEFLREDGEPVEPRGGTLEHISRISMENMDPRLEHVSVKVACDVDNPLTGEKGAACVFGPQKGASPDMVEILENGLKNLAERIRQDLGMDIEHEPGSGAAGGLGGGLMAFAGGTLGSGIDLVLDAIGFDREAEDADLVITGEGKIDTQTLFGKGPAGVSIRARKAGCPAVAIGGSLEGDLSGLRDKNIQAYFSMINGILPEEEIYKATASMLETTAEQVIRTLILGREMC
jgi:glycerate kinase